MNYISPILFICWYSILIIGILLGGCDSPNNNSTENLDLAKDSSLVYQIEHWATESELNPKEIYDINTNVSKLKSELSEIKQIKVEGYFHPSEIRIGMKKNGKEGYTIIKPFSYVRKKNPSAGWPRWFAFDAILVNIGWVPEETIQHDFQEAIISKDKKITILGIVREDENLFRNQTIDYEIFNKAPFDIGLLWDLLNHQVRVSDKLAPSGQNEIPLFIELVEMKE